MPDNINMAQKICKADLIEQVYEATNFPKKEISQIMDSLFLEIKNALCAGSVIELRGFGTFEVKMRKGRENSRNPKTGKKVSVEPHGKAIFRAGSELKQKIWTMKI